MSADLDIASWPPRLEAVTASGTRFVRAVRVLAETGSTQDAARRMGLRPGEAVAAGRQTAGRGRLGRAWSDPEGDGVAITFVTDANRPERLAIGAAVAVAETVERFVTGPMGIKWPNDVMAGGRKLSGVLVECAEGLARIGVGINVNQRRFPPPLDERAVSLRQLAGLDRAAIDRLDVLVALIERFDEVLGRGDDALAAAYALRDRLAGRVVRLSTAAADGAREVRGRVVSVDPLHGLELAPLGGSAESVYLAAATTTVLDVEE